MISVYVNIYILKQTECELEKRVRKCGGAYNPKSVDDFHDVADVEVVNKPISSPLYMLIPLKLERRLL